MMLLALCRHVGTDETRIAHLFQSTTSLSFAHKLVENYNRMRDGRGVWRAELYEVRRIPSQYLSALPDGAEFMLTKVDIIEGD